MRLKSVIHSLAGLALVAGAAAAQSKPTLAVLPLTNSALGKANDELQPLSKGLADMLISSLAANTNIRVVERDRIQAVLEEQKLASGGNVDASTAVKLGKILGAHHMVTGVFITEVPKGTAAANMRISLRVFNVETSEVERINAQVNGKTDAILLLIDKLGATLNTELKLPDIPAPAREEHAASVKKQEKVPFQAVMLYSRALEAKDKGDKQGAVTLFKQSIDQFPAYEAPKKELEKLGVK